MGNFGDVAANTDTTNVPTKADGAWTDFTPSFAQGIGAIGNATYWCRYKYIGDKTVAVRVRFVAGTTTSLDATPGVYVLMNVPVGTAYVPSSQYLECGAGAAILVHATVRISPTGTFNFLVAQSSSVTTLKNLEGVHMSSGSAISFEAIYEIS